MCFGAWMFGKDRWNIGGVDESTARNLVDYAIEQGVNFLTPPMSTALANPK